MTRSASSHCDHSMQRRNQCASSAAQSRGPEARAQLPQPSKAAATSRAFDRMRGATKKERAAHSAKGVRAAACDSAGTAWPDTMQAQPRAEESERVLTVREKQDSEQRAGSGAEQRHEAERMRSDETHASHTGKMQIHATGARHRCTATGARHRPSELRRNWWLWRTVPALYIRPRRRTSRWAGCRSDRA